MATKKEKTIIFSNRLIVTAHILTITPMEMGEKFIIEIETINGKTFKEEIYDKEYSDSVITVRSGVLFGELSRDEREKATKIREQNKERVLNMVWKRVDKIKKSLP